jgi:hypothetical protein
LALAIVGQQDRMTDGMIVDQLTRTSLTFPTTEQIGEAQLRAGLNSVRGSETAQKWSSC